MNKRLPIPMLSGPDALPFQRLMSHAHDEAHVVELESARQLASWTAPTLLTLAIGSTRFGGEDVDDGAFGWEAS